MQELMSRHKAYSLSPRDCLKTTLFQKWQRMVAPPGKRGTFYNYLFFPTFISFQINFSRKIATIILLLLSHPFFNFLYPSPYPPSLQILNLIKITYFHIKSNALICIKIKKI